MTFKSRACRHDNIKKILISGMETSVISAIMQLGTKELRSMAVVREANGKQTN